MIAVCRRLALLGHVRLLSTLTSSGRIRASELPASGVFEGALPELVRTHYRAAGVLPVYVDDDQERWVLLGREVRRGQIVWSEFGGKIEACDSDAADTAVREFLEETHGVLDAHRDDLLAQARDPLHPIVWNQSGKYALFPLLVPKIELPPPPLSGEKSALCWVGAEQIMHAVQADQFHSLVGRSALGEAGAETFDVTLFSFFQSTLKIQGLLSSLFQIHRNEVKKETASETTSAPLGS